MSVSTPLATLVITAFFKLQSIQLSAKAPGRGKLGVQGGGAYKLLSHFTAKVNLNCRVIAKNDMEGRLQQASQKNKA